ncbi:PepSY-associated TM helix domain-containing protein, partial [Pseudonocardia pini]|uniref:PepSY-associated TM helix domain-containing protein n=1 Tax=Pseudonocardia pini TaxID=2758030 RepID=UPI0015F1146F
RRDEGGPPGTALRPLARRVHFLAAILVAPLLLLLCLTGLAYVFSPQIHDDLYAKQLYVGEVGEVPRPVAEQIATAMARHPEAELRSVVPPQAADRTTQVNLSTPGQEPGTARTVYVDPYTNYVDGELTTIGGRLPANVWLREFHSNLHLGEFGRLYSETAASWLPVIALGGLVLWLVKQGRKPRSAAEVLVPKVRGKNPQARLKSVHGPLGLWLAGGLVVMAVTGLMMSRFAGSGLFAWRAPRLRAAPVDVPPGPNPVGVDTVLEVARSHGLDGALQVDVPTAPGEVFTVAQTAPGLPIRRDTIAVDPYSAAVTEHLRWSDYPFLAQVRVLGTSLHTGTLFGLANQVLLALFAIGTIVLLVGGYLMWWKRSPYRGQLPPAPQAALRATPWPWTVVALVVAAALAWYLPTFGVTLVLFVAADVSIGAVRRIRARSKVPPAAGR